MGRFTINGTLTNCTCNIESGSTVTQNTVLRVTAKEGCFFNSETPEETYRYYWTYYGLEMSDPMRVNAEKTELSVTLSSSSYPYYLKDIAAEGTPIADEIQFTITGELINCTANYQSGTVLHSGDVITLTPNNGYEFSGSYTLKITQFGIMSDDVFTLSGNTLTYTVTTNLTAVNLDSSYTATKIPTALSTFVNIYFPTDDNLTQLANERFITNQSGEISDNGSYITKSYLLPFDMTDITSTDTRYIILGNSTTNISSKYSTSWKHKINMGSIVIPDKYKNVYDYINTECYICCPFFDIIGIDSKYVIGQTVTIDCDINMYDGTATLVLKSTFTHNECFYKTVKNVGFDVPYIFNNVNPTVINNISIPFIENNYRAFIAVHRNVPYISDSDYGKNNYFYSSLSSYGNGYFEISDIKLSDNIPQEIQTEIKQILSGGVFI